MTSNRIRARISKVQSGHQMELQRGFYTILGRAPSHIPVFQLLNDGSYSERVHLHLCTSRLQRTCRIRKSYILYNLFNTTLLIFHYTFNHISKDIPGQTRDPSVNLIMRLDIFHNHGGILKGQRSVEQRSETKEAMWIKLDAPEEKRMFDLGNSKD